MTGTELYIQRLLEANPLREPVLRSIVHSLQLPPGSRGLDAGCGIGLQMLLLADAVGPDGHITGIDLDTGLVAYGETLVAEAGLADRIAFHQGDVSSFPFDDDTFDWAWSADCIGYPVGEMAPLLAELIRMVKPGGHIIVLGWSSQQLLPGYPLLEARLNATCSAYIPFLTGKNSELHFLRAPRWFRAAGLEDVKAQTFVGSVQAPLERGERAALASLFEMLWGEPQSGVSPEDWAAYQRFCKPESPEFILDIPDYYAFFTYSMFQGKVAQHI